MAYDENRTQALDFCLLAKWSFHDTIKKRELALKIRECERERDGGWRGGCNCDGYCRFDKMPYNFMSPLMWYT